MSFLARHASVSPDVFEDMDYQGTLRLIDAVVVEVEAEDKLAEARHLNLLRALGARL